MVDVLPRAERVLACPPPPPSPTRPLTCPAVHRRRAERDEPPRHVRPAVG